MHDPAPLGGYVVSGPWPIPDIQNSPLRNGPPGLLLQNCYASGDTPDIQPVHDSYKNAKKICLNLETLVDILKKDKFNQTGLGPSTPFI